jgi:hypothetical protein
MRSGWLGSWVCATILFVSGMCYGEAGAPLCVSSDACAAPTPYCQPALQQCVECLSSRNCAPDQACDVTTGQCVKCNDDADCPQERPYCTAGGCVECRTRTNCANSNLECVSGVCGTCGDGTCSKRERWADFGESFPGTPRPVESCPEDCAGKCVEVTPGDAKAVRVEIGAENLFETFCSSVSIPDAMLAFTASTDGTYYATIRRVAGEESYFSLSIIEGACPGQSPSNCGYTDSAELNQQLSVREGDSYTLAVESPVPGTFEVTIGTTPPPCQGPLCGPGGGGDAGPNDLGKTACLESARDRGDEMCEGVTCACSHCPRDYDDCAIIPGCAEVSACFRTKDCVGQDCFDTGACSGVINSYGGPRAPAFRAANALQSCGLAFSCGLPCGDAGTGSSPDAGVPLCTPGKARTCSCADGGTGNGEQTCNQDGSAFSDCKCHASVPKDEDSSCECGLSRAESSGASVAATLGFMGALLMRKGRRRKHQQGRAR